MEEIIVPIQVLILLIKFLVELADLVVVEEREVPDLMELQEAREIPKLTLLTR